MWQLRECEQGYILSTDQRLWADRKIQRNILSDEAYLQTWKPTKHWSILKKAKKKNLLRCYCFPDHKVQYISVKGVTPQMYDMWGAILGWKCVCVCVCISKRRRYLGLCDESVSVASKVRRAACRLLIHIRRGWLEPVADDTGRCWEMEGQWREKLDRWTKAMCRDDPWR